MQAKQVYSIINEINSQLWGEKAAEVIDASGLISLGDEIISSSTNTDAFLGALIDRIGRTVIRRLDLTVQFKNIISDSFEFGAVLQKLTVEPITAVESQPWLVGNTGYTPNQFAISKPTVRQSLFSNVNTWCYKVSIPDQLFKTAFTSQEQMGSFIDAIISSLSDSMTMGVNDLNGLCVNNFIAEKISSDRNVIHLLSEYNQQFDTTITVDSAITTPSLLRYVSKRMGDMIRYMSRPTKLFNESEAVRETKRDNMHVFINGEFASAYNIYMQADTFHNELTSLPLYEEVSAWQGLVSEDDGEVTTIPTFVESSTINLKTGSGKEVEQSGIIGAFIDRQAIGTTIYRPRLTTDRNNDGEYTNYSSKCDLGLYNDLSENGVIFVLD